jgi:hypothetical protein
MAKVFICHRSADCLQAKRLADAIQDAGHRVWLDVSEIGVGDQIVEQMNYGLGDSKYLVLCYSSAGDSPWTSIEWASALSRQLDGLHVKVLPVRLTGTQGPAILGGTKYADLLTDWDKGLAELREPPHRTTVGSRRSRPSGARVSVG